MAGSAWATGCTTTQRSFSGGEQQRVALARAFTNRPALLFADEPTGNLDDGTSGKVRDLLFSLNEESGATLILVTHDLALARLTQRIIRLQGGRVGRRSANPMMVWLGKMAWRDSRSHRRKLLLFTSSISIGIGALVGLGSLSATLQGAMDQQAAALLGGRYGPDEPPALHARLRGAHRLARRSFRRAKSPSIP